MANTYYDSELSSDQIDRALKAISDVVSASNNGKVLCITDGRIDARSAASWSGSAVLQPGSASANGDYTPPAGVDGFNSFHVEVPATPPRLQAKTANENGIVTPDSGYDGLSKVTVDVSGAGGTVCLVGNTISYTAQNYASSFEPQKALEQFGYGWVAAGTGQSWWMITLSDNFTIKKIEFRPAWQSGSSRYYSKTVVVQASNDGSNWTDLLTLSDLPESDTVLTYDIENSNSYNRYRLVCQSGSSAYTGFGRLRMYGS